MILADTSAWIEHDRATGSTVDQRLSALIRGDGPLAVTEPVVMEVLAGARSDAREHDLRAEERPCCPTMPISIASRRPPASSSTRLH